MTQFISDVRRMTDEVGAVQESRIELMVRFPAATVERLGLDWKAWMRRLVDAVVSSFGDYGAEFDIDSDRIIAMGHRTGVKVYGCIFQSLGFFETDATPEDESIGPKYDKAKTRDLYYVQAMLYHRAEVDGIQLAMSASEWNCSPFLDDLADPDKMLYADKRYMVNLPEPGQPVMVLDSSCPRQAVSIRIAEDPIQSTNEGRKIQASILLYARRYLQTDERVELSVNRRGKVH